MNRENKFHNFKEKAWKPLKIMVANKVIISVAWIFSIFVFIIVSIMKLGRKNF